MVNEPIKLENNLNLYSGDIVTINNSNPLLVEVDDAEKNTIKLRNIKDNDYLSKKTNKSLTNLLSKSRSFSTDFENALIFIVKQNSDGRMSLQRKDKKDEYLEVNDKKFYLSPEEKWLIIIKQQSTENIANYEETIEDIELYEDRKKEIKSEKVLTDAPQCYDNKSGNTLKHTFKFTESIQKEYNFTLSTDFTWGVSADLKLAPSAVATIGVGGKFEKKSSTSNTIKNTETRTFEKSFDIPCSPWKRTRVKLEAQKVKIVTPCKVSIKRMIGKRSYEYLTDGEYVHDDYSESNYSHEEITTRNILIVGWTGSGKSTLANVLSSSKDFIESNKSTPETKWGRPSSEFEWKGNYYCVIDNIGFGDTEVNEKEELIRIGKAISEVSQGLSHVLFVYKKRFSDKEKEAFGKLNALKITESLITIVRTNFDNFKSKERRENDIKSLKEEDLGIKQTINSCRGLLHVNNNNDKNRNTSREIVLDHLHDSCERNPFKPEEWEKIEDIKTLIENYFAEKEKLEKEKDQADTIQKEEEIKQQIDDLETNTAEQVRKEIQENEIFQLAQIIQEAK
ncbi:protein of unknown function (AIG1 domain) [endosymbiont DhMRE of Dentiscutata heterogama]|uniref:GTPase n=1 Tax=endosymbiont DhMRE of Dentiscutata heterogama TaxID=1609546 RepID=UPI000629D792|nr:GTPase [endosymbiont DhMRE of Dentiscutata heterogama]CFW93322.1 protein of unknown function (AIG1 domain) [endosymbiont DhMRE of Dentiscutata heterogama]